MIIQHVPPPNKTPDDGDDFVTVTVSDLRAMGLPPAWARGLLDGAASAAAEVVADRFAHLVDGPKAAWRASA